MATFTDQALRRAITSARRAQRNRWLTETLGRGEGSLTLKITATGAHWYYVYTLTGTQTIQRYPIGPYGAGGISLANARDRARALATIKRTAPGGDVHASLEALEMQRRAEETAGQRQAEEARQAQENAERYTLKALTEHYVQHLHASHKKSVHEVRNALKRHVLDAFPTIAATPARCVTRQEITDILRRLIEQGKGRMAGKVRAYLRAAYALGQRAASDPVAPQALVAFTIDSNPVAEVAALTQYNRARDRALSQDELAVFWRFIRQQPGVLSEALQVSLLLGGQRLTQLLRVAIDDYQDGQITLYDPKGRRTQARTHVLPVSPPAAEILDHRVQLARSLNCPWLFTSTGRVPVVESSLSHWVRDWVHRQTAIPYFSVGDLRRTCETLLAGRGVTMDLRAQIQSHGLGGVQHRHYDRHAYLEEKRTALMAWSTWLVSLERGVN